MSNRGGGSRYRGDDEQARRFDSNRGVGSWQDDDPDPDDRFAPPPRRQGSSQGSPRAGRPQPRYDQDEDDRGAGSRAGRANTWDNGDGWGDQDGGPAGWNDPRFYDERQDARASGIGLGRGASAARSRRNDADGRSFPIGGLLVALVSIAVLAGLGFGGYKLLTAQAPATRPTTLVAEAPFATYTPGPTPAPIANFKEFASARAKYVLSYPNTWAVSSNEGKLQQLYDYTDVFNPPNSPSHVSVEQADVFSYYNEQRIIQGEVAGAQQSGFTFTEVATAQTTQTVGGAQWQRREYDINANGQPLHMAILATHHSGKGYVIVLVSSAAEFGNDAQAVFDPMLASFRFSA
jgi:hypothetical protein